MQAFMCRLPCTYEFLKRFQTDMFQETNAQNALVAHVFVVANTHAKVLNRVKAQNAVF